jgi:hypothetical protein
LPLDAGVSAISGAGIEKKSDPNFVLEFLVDWGKGGRLRAFDG